MTLTSVGELEVVVEAVLDRRADRDLGPRVELQHRLGHHVGGVVADQLERLGVAVGEDLDLGSPSGSGAERSRSSPSTVIASAALARPGPIAAAASAPVAPSGSSSGLPSGSVTVIFGRGLHARPCYLRRSRPSMPHCVSRLIGGALAGLAHGDQRAGARAAERAGSFPEHVGVGVAAQAQARRRAACARCRLR